MKITERSKFWLVVTLIIITGLIGGVLGNWIFIYLLDQYYGIPGGNYAAAPAPTNIIVRQPTRPSISAIADVAATVEKSLVGIFRPAAAPAFLPATRIAQGVIVTSDGWLVTSSLLPADKDGTWDDYTVAAAGRQYDIDKVIFDAPSQLSFVHLIKANSLPVQDFVMSHELTFFQPLYGLEWQGSFESGLLGHSANQLHSSDNFTAELNISGLSGRSDVIFDQSGRLVGLLRGKNILAMETVKALTDKLLTDGKIQRARLGLRYALLSAVTGSSQEGALISGGDQLAIVAGSPAEKADLHSGDIITSFADVQIGAGADIAALVLEYKPGDTVTVSFMRAGVKKQASITFDAVTEK